MTFSVATIQSFGSCSTQLFFGRLTFKGKDASAQIFWMLRNVIGLMIYLLQQD
jgi:hypothetical protein